MTTVEFPPGRDRPPDDVASLDQFATSFRIDDDSETQNRSVFGRDRKGFSPIRYELQNRTPYLIRIEHDDFERYGELVIPPFGERLVVGARLKPFESKLQLHRQRHELRVSPYHEEQRNSTAPALLLGAIAVVVAVFGYDVLRYGSLRRAEFLVASTLSFAVSVMVLVRAYLRERSQRTERLISDSDAREIALSAGGGTDAGNETTRRASHLLVLMLIVLIGAILPAIAIAVATDTRDFIEFKGGLRVVPGQGSRLTSRVIQMIYVAILGLFPALLYFQFDRHRVGTIWGQWVRSIFRMDGRLRTLADLNARYGDELNEASNNSTKSTRFIGGNHSPIVVATILIALGWTVLVLQTESFDFSAISEVNQQADLATDAAERATEAAVIAESAGTEAEEIIALKVTQEALNTAESASLEASTAAAESAGDTPPVQTVVPDTPPPDADGSVAEPSVAEQARTNAEQAVDAAEATQSAQGEVLSTSYFQLLSPRPSAAGMAFLGTYFFAVYLVLRSYFRGDLRPKVYNQITARLVTIVVVTYLINVLLFGSNDQRILMALAFLAGIIPRTIVRQVLSFGNELVDKMTSRASITIERSLTKIDGVDLYDASLLESVGISDVPALANTDIVAAMVATRLPIDQLVDWADQAALLTVLSSDDETDSRIVRLRGQSIRTASDFVTVCEEGSDEDRAVIATCLDEGQPGRDGPTLSMCGVAKAIKRQPVWGRVDRWRRSDLAQIGEWMPLPPFPTGSSAPPPVTVME